MDYKNHFDFIKHRKYFYMFSLAVTILGLVMLLTRGLNLGVDFKAGTSIDINVGQAIQKADAEAIFQSAGVTPAVTTIGGNNNDRVSARFNDVLDEPSVKKVDDAFKAKYSKASQEVSTVSPDIAKELAIKAIYAVLIASLAISIYISIRFEWRFALAGIISILYDAFFVISMFTIFQVEVDLPFVAAVLTTIGYSINDKIVIFDRIRENMRFAKLKSEEDLANLVNQSIWQTMARSINTVITVLLAAGCLYIFGSHSIKLFALAKIFGLTSGVYSSLAIATSLWFFFRKNNLQTGKKPAAAAKPVKE